MKIPRIDLVEYERSMRSVDWSPDGRLLAVSDIRGVVIMDNHRRTVWRTEPEAGLLCNVVRFSWDGLKLASGCYGRVVVRNSQGGDFLLSKTITGGSLDLAWSPDSSRILSSGVSTVVFDVDSGETELNVARVSSRLDWPSSGQELLVGGDLYAVGSGEFVANLTDARSCRCGPETANFAAGLENGRVEVWNIPNRRRQYEFAGHEKRVSSVAWHPEGQVVASGSEDSTVRLWSLAEDRELAMMEAHKAPVKGVCFSPDGNRLASVSSDKTLQIWDVSQLTAGQPVSEALGLFGSYVERQAASVGRRAVLRALDRWVPERCEYRGRGSQANGVAVCADARTMVMGSDFGALRRVDLETGRALWDQQEAHRGIVGDLVISKDGRLAASTAGDGFLRVWEISSGSLVEEFEHDAIDANGRVEFSSDGDLVSNVTGRHRTLVWSLSAETVPFSREGELFLAWHPTDEAMLLVGPEGVLQIRDYSGVVLEQFERAGDVVELSVWSQTSGVICTVSAGGEFQIWRPGRRRPLASWQGPTGVHCLGWSPSGKLLASGGEDGVLRLWNPSTGEELCHHELGGYVWRLSWAPNGSFIAVTLEKDVVRILDTREMSGVTRRALSSSANVGDLSPDLAPLPTMLEALSRQGLAVPLSWIDSLLSVWSAGAASRAPNGAVAEHPTIKRLIGLNWPLATRAGLLALLLLRLPRAPEWQPPKGMSPSELRSALTDALAGKEIPVRAPALPTAALLEAADRLDERFFSLLEMVGPSAVASDPGLPLRLLDEADKLPPIESARRQLLGLKLNLDEEGTSQGSGQGAERTGIELSGDFRSLLPSQLALPDSVLRAQHLRGELLHRARAGQEPPRLRPTVLVLDVSPPTFGPVESMTRLAAHTVAISLLDAGVPVVLVTAGGRGTLRVLERREDLVEIWTARSQEEADAPRSLATARAMAETLRGGALEPVVLVMSQVFFGAGARPDRQSGVRGLFVSYPDFPTRPAFAPSCERWRCLEASQVDHLSSRLGELVA